MTSSRPVATFHGPETKPSDDEMLRRLIRKFAEGRSLREARSLRAIKGPFTILPLKKDGFYGYMQAWQQHKLFMTHFKGDGFSMFRVAESLDDIYDKFVHISILISGNLTVKLRGRKVVAEPGQGLTLLPDNTYTARTSDASEILTVFVLRSVFESRGIRTEALQGLRWNLNGGGRPLLDLSLLAMSDTDENATARKSSFEWAIIELLLSLMPLPMVNYSSFNREQINFRSQVASIIEQSYSDCELSPRVIAQRTGISRRKLYRLFQDSDESVAQIIKERRLTEAQKLLRRFPELSIRDIAEASGFNGTSSLTRAFKEHFGCSPRWYRENGNFGGAHGSMQGLDQIRASDECSLLTSNQREAFRNAEDSLVETSFGSVMGNATNPVPQLNDFSLACEMVSRDDTDPAETLEIWRYNQLLIMRFVGIGKVAIRKREILPEELNQSLMLIFVKAGDVRAIHRASTSKFVAGSVSAVLEAQLSRLEIGQGADVVVCQVPTDIFNQRGIAIESLAGMSSERSELVNVVHSIVTWAMDLQRAGDEVRKRFIERSLLELFVVAAEFLNEKISDKNDIALVARRRALDIIKLDFEDPELSATTIARKLGLSARQLYRLFEGDGFPIAFRIRERRVDHATELLRNHPEMTIAQIATASGFIGSDQFSKAFRRHRGLSPSKFRHNMQCGIKH